MYRSIQASTAKMAKTPTNEIAQPHCLAISERTQEVPIPKSSPPTHDMTRLCMRAWPAQYTETIATAVVRQHVPKRFSSAYTQVWYVVRQATTETDRVCASGGLGRAAAFCPLSYFLPPIPQSHDSTRIGQCFRAKCFRLPLLSAQRSKHHRAPGSH